MFGATLPRPTLHLPATPQRWATRLARRVDVETAEPSGGVLRRVEHTLAGAAAATPSGGIDVARPLSTSVSEATGVLRLEFAAGDVEGIGGLVRQLAVLLSVEGISRVDVRLVAPGTSSTLARRSIEAPSDDRTMPVMARFST